jgi:hypothetical protein
MCQVPVALEQRRFGFDPALLRSRQAFTRNQKKLAGWHLPSSQFVVCIG